MVLDADDGLYFPNDLTAEDLDLDGDVDLIVPAGFFVCEFAPRIGPCGALIWLEQSDEGWQQHDIVPNGDARFYHRGIPVDVDGDGDLDVGSAEYFFPGASYVWFENTADGATGAGPFTRHVMTDELGRAIRLEVVPTCWVTAVTAGSARTTSTP